MPRARTILFIQLANFIPLIGLLVLALLWSRLQLQTLHLVLFLIFWIYLLPPFLYRLWVEVRGKNEGHFEIDSPEYITWWVGLQFQALYSRFTFLEEILKFVPMLYSGWLRLWGAKLGKAIYWSPQVLILDRGLVAIGDFVIIESGATIGDNCRLYGQVYVGKNVVIGSDSIVYAGVKIYNDCQIGERCILQSGAIIGSDGFGFAPQADGTYKKIQHVGYVILEDDVEIGANTTIDRGSIGATMIRRGVKLDNLIQVAHNVEIGENTVIAAQTGIAGSTKIGKNGRIGGQVGFGGHLVIGNFVQIQGQSGVINNQPDNVKLYGTPAIDFMRYMRSFAIFKKLPDMFKRLNALEK